MPDEQVPPQEEQPSTPSDGVIDSVPGVEKKPEDQQPEAVFHGDVISTPADQFKGDPSKVLGHPSNPGPDMIQAAADLVTGAAPSTTPEVTPEVTTPEATATPEADAPDPMSPPTPPEVPGGGEPQAPSAS
jgi:hypothetical protein